MGYADLGAQVDAAWATTNYDPKQFPAIAKHALDAAALDACERERLAMDPPPPIPYRDNPRFQIEVRTAIWTSADIRDDPRLGAQRVAEGSGILSQFTFIPDPAPSGGGGAGGGGAGTAMAPTARFGVVEQQGSSIARGDAGASEVTPTAESVFPLERPLKTVVITLKPPGRDRPWLYQRPGVSLYARRVADDLAGTQIGPQADAIDHARWFYDVIDTLRRARRSRRPDLRFFLALLITQQKRDFLLRLVQQWTHTERLESIDIVAHWVEGLIRLGVLREMEPDPVPSPEFFRGWWTQMDDVEAVTFLLRLVRMPGNRAPYGRIPPPV